MIYSRRNREAQGNGRKKPETMEQAGKWNKGNVLAHRSAFGDSPKNLG